MLFMYQLYAHHRVRRIVKRTDNHVELKSIDQTIDSDRGYLTNLLIV